MSLLKLFVFAAYALSDQARKSRSLSSKYSLKDLIRSFIIVLIIESKMMGTQFGETQSDFGKFMELTELIGYCQKMEYRETEISHLGRLVLLAYHCWRHLKEKWHFDDI